MSPEQIAAEIKRQLQPLEHFFHNQELLINKLESILDGIRELTAATEPGPLALAIARSIEHQVKETLESLLSGTGKSKGDTPEYLELPPPRPKASEKQEETEELAYWLCKTYRLKTGRDDIIKTVFLTSPNFEFWQSLAIKIQQQYSHE